MTKEKELKQYLNELANNEYEKYQRFTVFAKGCTNAGNDDLAEHWLNEAANALAASKAFRKYDDAEILLEAYNDYIEDEFNERRNTKLDIQLGLMYTEHAETGENLYFYYDTDSEVFWGTCDEKIVYEKYANYIEAVEFIRSHDFNDYYDMVTESDYYNVV